MERGFEVDLQPVRIHADAEAGSLARAAQARAFASGTDIYFAPGTFRPGSPAGDEGGKSVIGFENGGKVTFADR